jgi:hypothetical protein
VGADCGTPPVAPFSDGAAFDPRTRSWTELAPSPVPIGYARSAVVGDVVYLLVAPFGSSHRSARDAFLAYEMTRDEWTELELPPDPRYRQLVADDRAVVAYQHSQETGVEKDFVYDPRTSSWSELAPDPLQPSYDRWMVATSEGPVLTAIDIVPDPGATEPSLYRAAVFDDDGKWRRLPDSEVMGYNPEWFWTAGRVVNPSIESGDGGETNNWGRTYYAGGILDPRRGQWSTLPDTPTTRGDFTGIYAGGPRYATAGGGWAFDGETSRWLELSRPTGAPESEAAATWVGDELFVWGGVRYEGSDGILLDDGWSWAPHD